MPEFGAGARLGKYEILKHLATGGMAQLFLARTSDIPGFQKIVAIKRILPKLATEREFIEMFLDEARIAATLQHANIVQMYDVAMLDGSYFISMEYVHGQDVRSILKKLFVRKERMPFGPAIGIVMGVAAGLHYAHEKTGLDGLPLEIVHRDVTPQNVMVTYEGEVKLLDFGVARASNKVNQTRVGFLKGKVAYMSPEQGRGEPIDRGTDIFALGIMLYELTVGRKLFKAKSDFEILKLIVEGEVTPPSSLVPEYPPELEAVVLKALSKKREDRYQTARDVEDALDEVSRTLALSSSRREMSRFMERLFGRQLEAWQKAKAEGKSLEEHIERGEIPLDSEDLLTLEEADATATGSISAESRASKSTPRARKPSTPPRSPGQSPSVTARTVVVEDNGLEDDQAALPHSQRRTQTLPSVHVDDLARNPFSPEAISSSRSRRHGTGSRNVPRPQADYWLPVGIGVLLAAAFAIFAWKMWGGTMEGTLVISSKTTYSVSIDNVPRGLTPLNVQLMAGQHTVTATQPTTRAVKSFLVTIAPDKTIEAPLDP